MFILAHFCIGIPQISDWTSVFKLPQPWIFFNGSCFGDTKLHEHGQNIKGSNGVYDFFITKLPDIPWPNEVIFHDNKPQITPSHR